ncbi:hypothetical protein GCM10010439_05700 [Actinocorallia aurantiaca]|uniref:Uncharacterized protein n=1 Tax=Actinocorallia aurantiaca TaxID=46204 RepID=A0ABN3TV64_9ACTN
MVTDEDVMTEPLAGVIWGAAAAFACAGTPAPSIVTSGATATSALSHTRKIPSATPGTSVLEAAYMTRR